MPDLGLADLEYILAEEGLAGAQKVWKRYRVMHHDHDTWREQTEPPNGGIKGFVIARRENF